MAEHALDMQDDFTADGLRRMANRHFVEQNYDSALSLYSLAVGKASIQSSVTNSGGRTGIVFVGEADSSISQNVNLTDDAPSVVIHLCNRSACLFKMGRFDESAKDAATAFQLSDGQNAKAAFRLAKAQIELSQYEDAASTLDTTIQYLDTLLTNKRTDIEADEDESNKSAVLAEQRELTKLRSHLQKKQQRGGTVVRSIKAESRKPSIKEFELGTELGFGNFSQIVVARHRTTDELFALKIIEKKKAESLAKRQHPNVYNEINMERRVLGERLPQHLLIIRMYHSFQDYSNLYFLNELHIDGGEMWKKLVYQNKLVGGHPSLIRFYLAELVEALEHMHKHAIVHRDLKAENILIASSGHIVVIDFGTAKDLEKTDLNGPEFVGTPDFMSPEAVKATDEKLPDGEGADHTADLWALGVLAYQLYTGHPCFMSQSPYLTFLRIQRGNIFRPYAVTDDDAWDLITKLVQVDPNKRLGANCVVNNGEARRKPGNLADIRNHSFFKRGNFQLGGIMDFAAYAGELILNIGCLGKSKAIRIPALKDLCILACADLVRFDSMNLDIPDPGDGSNHDLLRLSLQDRAKIMHVLDGLKIISEPRVFRRFFSSKQEARLSKVQPSTHTVFGSSFHDHGPSTIREDEHPITIQFMHLTNPLFNKETNNTNNDCGNRGIDALNENCHHDEAQRSKMREDWLEQLKESIRRINKFRPKFVVASGNDINEKCRKLIAKISETVPVILCDGKQFASFWHKGYVFLSLRGKYLSPHQEPDIDEATSATEVREEDGRSVESRDLGTESCRSIQCHNATFREQMSWVTEQLEQVNMGMRNTMIFVDCDPRQLSPLLIKKFMKNKVFCVIGSSLSPKYSVERKSEEELNEACCLKGSSYAPDEDIDCSSSDGENDEVEKNRKAKKTITLISGSLSIITMEQNSWNEVGLLIDEV